MNRNMSAGRTTNKRGRKEQGRGEFGEEFCGLLENREDVFRVAWLIFASRA